MNYAHIHLLINHSPIFGTGFGVLILIYGLVRKSCEVARTGFLLLILSALLTVPTYFTGDPASDVIKPLPQYQEPLVEEHEASATYSFIFVGCTAVVALAALYALIKTKECKPALTISVLVIALFTFATFIRTAQLGGRISHVELRSGYVLPPPSEDKD